MESPSYRFGEIYVDLSRMVVTRGGQPVDLEPKAFDVLRLLLAHRDRLVTKDELLAVVWPDTFVTPNVLTRAIAQLRKALGDDAQEAKYIETLPKRGYRFIAVVETEGRDPAAETERAVAARPAVSPRARRGRVAAAAVVLIVSAAFLMASVWVVFRRPADAGATTVLASTPSRVTTRRGANVTPTLSPDGSTVAYVSDRSGTMEIYVAGLARGSREVALTADGAQNLEPAWSPDGKWIAFHSRVKGGIWIVPSTGGTPTVVVDSGSQPAWSPDSESIVFSSHQGAMAAQSTLRIVRRDGSQLRELTRLGQPAGGHQNPTWSHDGKLVAFAVSNGLVDGTAWLVPANGGAAVALPTVGYVGHLAFAASDDALYFGGGIGTARALYRLPIDSATGAGRGPASLVVPLATGYMDGLSISRTGTVAYGISTSDAGLWTIDLKKDGTAGEPVRLTNDTVRVSFPSYSPDGRRLAFVQVGIGIEPSTWIMDEDGEHREPLLTEGSSGSPSWSGNGPQVLVQRDYIKPRQPMWLIDTATGRATPLPALPDEGVHNPRISPDGRAVAYWRIEANGAMNTYTQSLDGSGLAQVTHDAEAINYPAWSPDGQWLAVEIKREEVTHIGVVSRRGGAVEQLTHAGGQSWPRSWSPDGEWVAFAGERNGVWNVWSVSRRTHETRQLTRFTSASGNVGYPMWSPRGNRIVFERQTGEGSVWTLQLR